jgi:sugar phosphate isomerase/epimerase
MTEPGRKQSKAISRRTFCRSAIAAAAAIPFAGAVAQASQTNNKVKFYKNLGLGHIGVRADQRQALEYAVKYGFDGITPNPGEFENKSAAEIHEWVEQMKEKGVRYGTAGLPVEFRRDEDRHRELTYLQNFERYKKRFREVATVLGDYDIRLGLEFVGPRTSRSRSRFPFISTQIEMMELVVAIGTPNVGLLLDSWHWYTSHGTVEELHKLLNKDVVHVHVNDAPAGIPVDKQVDNRRALPVTTGVIDMKGFINALVKIGYDGPVECEPFDQELRKMEDNAALQKTIESLNRLRDLIEV